MQNINLSINPTYLCNFRCNFCYLTKEQLSDEKILNLKKLEQCLLEIAQFRNIKHIDLYGGEIGLLSEAYLNQTKLQIKRFSSQPINIITNLSTIHPFFLEDDIDLAVSWDYNCRQNHKKVLQNIISIRKDVHILMLASPQMLNWPDSTIDEVIQIFSDTPNVTTIEIKPYSSNQANQFKHTDEDFENFIIKWLLKKDSFHFEFINEHLIKESIHLQRNSWSDDHLYITPNGKIAVLGFDKDNHEFFQELNKFSDYLSWCQDEKIKINQNQTCNNCQYHGHCLSEHLREVYPEDISCSGFKNLLNWYTKNLSKTTAKKIVQINQPH